MTRRLDCHDAIKQVKNSYETAVRTVAFLIRMGEAQPDRLWRDDLDLSEVRSLAGELEDLYFTRMFASFESSLRDFWRTEVRNSKPHTRQLLSSIAVRRGVPRDTLDAVQEIRDFRNSLIHEEAELRGRFTLDAASRHLNKFLARLPFEW